MPNQAQNDVELKVWKTIKLGTGIKDAEGFRAAITARRKIGPVADDLMSKAAFTVATEPREVDLVLIDNLGDLGLEGEPTLGEIYEAAQKRGLELCPAEVGPQLRLQYTDQWMNSIAIGMEPIIGSDGGLYIFGVMHFGNNQWLEFGFGRPDRIWDASSPGLVFVLPRK